MSAENVGITNSSNGASPPDPAMVESSRDAGVTWASLPPDKVEASPDDVVDETPHLVRQLSQLSLELEPEEKEMAILQASSQAKEALERYSLPLSKSDKVLVMQGWNKVLAFRTAFSEALLCHWRLLVTLAADDSGAVDTVAASIRLCERNQDPLATALGDRLWEAEDLIMGLLDGALRSLCPATQVVARESYRPIADDIALQKQRSAEGLLTLECETVEDYLLLLAQCGVQPKHWVEFIDAVAWALKTHAPYAQAADEEDLDKGHESAYLKATVQLVCLPAIDAYVDLRSLAFQYLYSVQVPQFWRRYNETARLGVGEVFYKTLLTKYPSLMDYFARTDMDSLAAHLMMTLDLLVKSVTELGHAEGTFRLALNDLARVHCRLGISTFNYMIVGVTILEVLDPLFQREEELTKDSEDPVTAKEMFNAFLRLYKEVMSIVYYPMLKQEKLMAEVKEFYRQIQEEFKWSDARLDGRIMEIEEEISLTGTYTQTSEELEMGARLAWRNSAKCIGRISWNTLQVRDCRHVSNPANIFREVEMHLKIATAGSSIQSVMTVFAPKKHWEMFGTRFWSSQYVRYAGYAMEDGTVIGDPANAEITQYLIDRNMWEPPERRTAFDVLPLVLKIPGKEKPFIYKLPSRCIFEVDLEHPSNPAISALGYRWTTIPAISNFKMTLGGVTYQNIPFNGWFMSTEIVRNLMERYNAGPAVAEALGIDIATNNAWRYAVAYELERAVLYSFRKNKYTIVDPHSLGESFCTHVRREREKFGRECPSQWSWIGGLTGPTNPTWHLEMRDFLVKPQYDYAIEGHVFHSALLGRGDDNTDANSTVADTTVASTDVSSLGSLRSQVPRVLIVYGSETGTAEGVARELKKKLKVLTPRMCTLDEAASLSVVARRRVSHVLCVCSTFGVGGCPSNAAKFFKTPIVEGLPSTTKFAVLALGSTLYPDFCQAGITVDQMLRDAGFEQIIHITTADEVAGGATKASEWVDLVKRTVLPPHLAADLLPETDECGDASISNSFNWYHGLEMQPTEQTGTRALCVENEALTANVVKITFAVPESSSYVSGDHLVVQPVNSPGVVLKFLECFSTELASAMGLALAAQSKQSFVLETFEGDVSGPADVFFSMPTTLESILTKHIDLAMRDTVAFNLMDLMKQRLIEVFVSLTEESDTERVTNNELVKEFLSLYESLRQDKANVNHLIAQFPSLLAFFDHFRPLFLDKFVEGMLCREGAEPLLSLADVLAAATRLQSRYYSISSSDRVSPEKITITVGVLETTTSKGAPITGVCSHYLASLKPGADRAVVGISKSSFRLPETKEAPLIMVGAGTGLSPMMGFLQDRALDAANGEACGPIHLFFGCRDESSFMYEELIRGYEASGLLTLHLAFSRSKSVPKAYVQHKLVEMGQACCDLLLDPDTHYYVCGDARMANDCHENCVQILRRFAVMSRVAAVHHLKKMRMAGRWQTDVWGIVSHFEESKEQATASRKAAAKTWLKHFSVDDNYR